MVSWGLFFNYVRRFRTDRCAGPSYTDWDVFDLSYMEPYNLKHLHEAYAKATDHFVLYLPRTSDVRQLVKLNKSEEKLKVIHYCMHGASKALCAFYGTFELE